MKCNLRGSLVWSLLVYVGVLLAHPVMLHAHRNAPKASVILQVDPQGLAALWTVQLRGPVVEVLRRSHDNDGNGTLDDAEREILSAQLGSRAVASLEIYDERNATVRILPTLVQADTTLSPSGKALKALLLSTLTDGTPIPGTVLTLKSHNDISVTLQGHQGWEMMVLHEGPKLAASQNTERRIRREDPGYTTFSEGRTKSGKSSRTGPTKPMSFTLSRGMEVRLEVIYYERRNP